MDLVQALTVDSADTSVGVSNTWTWAQPSPPSGAVYSNGTLFSSGGTNSFTVVEAPGAQSEQVRLLQKWYSAAKDMVWNDDCKTEVPGTAQCYVYPVSAFPLETAKGARSKNVVHVPDVYKLSFCNPATGGCSADASILNCFLRQQFVSDILVPGKRCNATWFMRAPTVPLAEKKLAQFVIGFTYTTSGVLVTSYKGGATQQSSCADSDCANPESSTGNCPVALFGSTSTLSPEIYSGDIYTPFSFSFCVGQRNGLDTDGGPRCKSCDPEEGGDDTQDICQDPPGGLWSFELQTRGGSEAASCGNNPVPCKKADAAASLFIDGLMLTPTRGDFYSPVLDSLSANTVWTRIGWDFDFNLDALSNPRTPVYLKWMVSATFYADTSSLTETGSESVTEIGRYFRYWAALFSWDDNPDLLLRPPSKGAYDPCVRYSPMYDGSLNPAVKRITVEYEPDAGRFVSRSIAPARLRRWKQATFQLFADSANGGGVVMDICDGNMIPIMTNVSSPVSLTHLDPNQYPALRIRGTCAKNGNPGASPKVYWFRVEFETMKDCLELDHNSIRLSRGEQTGVLFCVDEGGTVDVKVYDGAGQLVKRVFHGELTAAPAYRQVWDGTDSRGKQVTAGLYFVTVSTPAGRYTKKIAVSR